MKKLSKNLAMYILYFGMFVAVFCVMTLKAEAANVTTGKLGTNDGITWTYDADTKTLTITGEDSGMKGVYDSSIYRYKSPFVDICGDVEVIKVKNCTFIGDINHVFGLLESLKRIEFENFNTSNVTDMSQMFVDCSGLTELDLTCFDTSKVKDMSYMFERCKNLVSVDVSKFDTTNVEIMSGMFRGCSSLTDLDLRNFNTSKVRYIYDMFANCSSLKSVNLTSFDTSQVLNMGGMFYQCENLEAVDLSNFNTANATIMSEMFYKCKKLTELDLSNFNTSQVKNMGRMFYQCSGLKKLDLSNFNTSTNWNLKEFLYLCSNLEEVNLSSFDTSNVTNASNMFSSCSSLKIIYTPKAIPESLTIYLPRTYADLKNNRTDYLTKDFCKTTLVDVNYLVSEIKLSSSTLTVHVGKTGQLTATVFPEKAIAKTVSWKSSNTAVATVDANGKVTAVAPGTATITATATDVGGVSASCSVTIPQLVTGITLNKSSMSLHTGKNESLTVTISPGNATNKAVTWKSSDATVATVSTSGKVTAVAPGKATITVTAKDGSGKSASCEVTVIRPVTGVTLNKNSVELVTGESETLTATVKPDNASNKALTWKSSDTTVATVSSSGKITAVGPGTATITATAKDGSGKSASCNVRVFSQQEKQVRAFVERMYTIVLGRAAEKQGLNDWTNRLMAKEIDGATLVDMFVNSDEFVNRNTSDEEYIKILYRAVLGREADSDGLKMWKDMLADDWTRDYILEGLVLSTEFKNICDSYGIIAAFEPTAESQVRSFVKRMYTVVLNRRADAVGLNEWTQWLLDGTANGAQVADGFISSDEFVNRNLSNEKYVKVLYRAFFNREPDEGGFNVWMNELAKGTSCRDVMKGFVHSVEFSDLCAAYGIIRGEIQ